MHERKLREAKDAGFSSLLEYLMFLQIYETYKTERGRLFISGSNLTILYKPSTHVVA